MNLTPEQVRAQLASLPLRDDLRGRTPYGAPQLDVAARLNVNENPYPLPDVVVDALARAVAEIAPGLNRYPDRDATELRSDLARYVDRDGALGLSAEHIWPANGSNEVMLHVMQAFGGPGRTALTFDPTYSMYPDYCRDTFTTLHSIPRRDDFSLDLDAALDAIHEYQPDVVLLTSPNNPTGTAVAPEHIIALYDATPGMVVIDEAYAEFRRPGTASAIELLADRSRLVVTRTMSKAFAMAGARVGYAIAAPGVVEALRLVRLPYHLSAITQVVARTALAHADLMLAQVDALRDERDRLVVWLREQGLTVADSDANFALFGRFRDRDAIWSHLLDRGVLIRQTGPEGWLRVSVGTPEEMASFRQALAHALENGVGS